MAVCLFGWSRMVVGIKKLWFGVVGPFESQGMVPIHAVAVALWVSLVVAVGVCHLTLISCGRGEILMCSRSKDQFLHRDERYKACGPQSCQFYLCGFHPHHYVYISQASLLLEHIRIFSEKGLKSFFIQQWNLHKMFVIKVLFLEGALWEGSLGQPIELLLARRCFQNLKFGVFCIFDINPCNYLVGI